MTEPGDAVQGDDGLSLDMVAAALRADSSDIAIYAKVLTESLGDSLPPAASPSSVPGACPTGCETGLAR